MNIILNPMLVEYFYVDTLNKEDSTMIINKISLLLLFSAVSLLGNQNVKCESCTMNITKKEVETISYYNQNAQKWADIHGPDAKISFWIQEINLFQEYVPQGTILEIGVGGAGEAAELIKKGYTYVGIDPAAALIKIAQERFAQATFLNKSVYDLDFLPHSFDGFWCCAVLLHIPKENIDLVLQKIKFVMKPGAIGFISLAEGAGEYYDEETKRYFYLYSQDEFADILKRNGFVIQKKAIRTQDTHRKWLRSWITCFVQVSA